MHTHACVCNWLHLSWCHKMRVYCKSETRKIYLWPKINQTYNNILLKVTGGWSLLCIFALCVTVAVVRWLLLLCIFMYLCHVLDRGCEKMTIIMYLCHTPDGAMVRWLVKSTLPRKITRVHKESTAKEQSWEGEEVWWPTPNTCWGV